MLIYELLNVYFFQQPFTQKRQRIEDCGIINVFTNQLLKYGNKNFLHEKFQSKQINNLFKDEKILRKKKKINFFKQVMNLFIALLTLFRNLLVCLDNFNFWYRYYLNLVIWKCVKVNKQKMENKLVFLAGMMVIVGVCIWVGVSGQQKSEFKVWKREFNVHYDSELEEVYREKIFFTNLALIHAHNSNPLRTYDQGLNQFSALTQEEFAHTFLHPSFHPSQPQKTGVMFDSEDKVEVGDINWVSNGAVTGVKNQGNCNSAYAFSAIGAIEGLGKIGKQKTLYSLSEQQVIDCSEKYGNYGCQRGYMDATYNYARDNAIYESKHYPYQGTKQSCQKQNGIMPIFAHLYVRNCTKLSSSLSKNPVSASVDASAWAFYKTGIFNNCPASPHSNHAVLVVGMVQNYWLVKNSWGTEWGENGYMKLPLGNSCGICSDGSYPVQ